MADDSGNETWWHPVIGHDISDYVELADRPADLVDRLNLVMTHGNLTASSQRRITQRIGQITIRVNNEEEDYRNRVWFAIWYMASLPDYIVETY